MDKLIYTAMSGAKSLVQRQDNIANNLANASTTGFRAEMLALRAVPVEAGAAGSTGINGRMFAQETTVGSDMTPGAIQRTGRDLDVAIEGRGWIAVQARDGGEAYTRAGSLQLDANGALRTSGGLPVLGDGGPLVIPPDSTVEIARDGTISATPATGARTSVVVVGRLKLVNPEDAQMKRGDDGLFRTASGQPAQADERVTLSPGAIEGSNVNPVEAMVGMIGAARQFDMQMKLISTADANAKSAAQLMSMAG